MAFWVGTPENLMQFRRFFTNVTSPNKTLRTGISRRWIPTSFDGNRPCFVGGLTFKNRGHWGSGYQKNKVDVEMTWSTPLTQPMTYPNTWLQVLCKFNFTRPKIHIHSDHVFNREWKSINFCQKRKSQIKHSFFMRLNHAINFLD